MNDFELGDYREHLRRGCRAGNRSTSLDVSIPEEESFRALEALGRDIVSEKVKQIKKKADWTS